MAEERAAQRGRFQTQHLPAASEWYRIRPGTPAAHPPDMAADTPPAPGLRVEDRAADPAVPRSVASAALFARRRFADSAWIRWITLITRRRKFSYSNSSRSAGKFPTRAVLPAPARGTSGGLTVAIKRAQNIARLLLLRHGTVNLANSGREIESAPLKNIEVKEYANYIARRC